MKDDVFNKAAEIKKELEKVEEDLKTLEWYKHANCRTKHLCREVTTITRGFIREGSSVDTYWDMNLSQEDIEIISHFRKHKKVKLEEEFKHLDNNAQEDTPTIVPCPFCNSTDVDFRPFKYEYYGAERERWSAHHSCKHSRLDENDPDTWTHEDGFSITTRADFDTREDAIEFWNRQCKLVKENLLTQ